MTVTQGSESAVIVSVISLLTEVCDIPKSSLLPICIFPVAKYVNVVITSIRGSMVFPCYVGNVSIPY